MDTKQIKQLFFDCAPDLPWNKINKSWRIKEHVISDREKLGEFRVLWTKDGRRGDTGSSIKLSEMRKDFSHVGQDWRRKVLSLASKFEEEKQPVQLFALSVKNLVIDGCHRTASIMMCECRFNLLLVELIPPRGIVWHIEDML